MKLEHLRISNCFGFGSTEVNLESRLIYILGRNSSGKTALLDGINNIAPHRIPDDHPRFTNFRPTTSLPQITASFVVDSPTSLNMEEDITELFKKNGLPPQALNEQRFKDAVTQLLSIYVDLFRDIAEVGTFKFIKFAIRQCQITPDEQFKETIERRKYIENVINRVLPNSTFNYLNTNHAVRQPTPSALDRIAAIRVNLLLQ
jgi:predicted ATP-dependent endonuclease of OLD family